MKVSIKFCFITLLLTGFLIPAIAFSQEDSVAEVEENQIQKEIIMDDIIITATKSEHKLSDIPESAAVISNEDIEASDSETAADVVRWISGVRLKRASFAPNSTTVRLLGLPSSYSLVLVNGQRVYGGGTERGSSQSVDLEQFPVEMIERIEIVKGPSSCLYGSEAVGGVINIITKKPPEKNQLFVSTESGTYNTKINKVSAGTSIGDFGFLVHYTQRSSDGREYESQHDLQKYESDNISADFTFKINDALKLSIQPSIYKQKEEYSDKNRSTTSLNNVLDYKINDDSKMTFRFSGHKFDSDWVDNNAMTKKAVARSEDNQKIETEVTYNGTFLDSNLVTLGYQHFDEKYNYYLIDEEVNQTANSLYIHDEIDLMPVVLTVGGRLDNYDRWGSNFYPQLGLLYMVSNEFKLKFSGAQAFKAPTFGSLYYQKFLMGGMYYIEGNPDLKPEKATGYQLGAEYQKGKFVMRTSLFKNEITDKIAGYTVKEVYKMGKALRSYRNIDKVITQGLEVNLSTALTDYLDGNLAYTLIDSEDVTSGEDLVDTPQQELSLELNIKESEYMPKINIRGEYIGKRYVEVTGKGMVELETYTLAHVKVSKKFFNKLNVYGAVNNIFAKEIEHEDLPEVEQKIGVSYNF